MRSPLSLLIAALTLTACATLTADADQLITVNTNPPGANCVLSNSTGSWSIAQTPGAVRVDRSFEPMGVNCSLAGVGSASTLIESSTRGRAYGNILLLGVPALVDDHTGAGYVYDTDNVTLVLQPPSPQMIR